LPDLNVTRFANRLRALRSRWLSGDVEPYEVRQRINAWVAHAQPVNTVQLRHTLFAGGWFDPLWANQSPVKASVLWEKRVLRGGSWTNNPTRLRSANRNINTPDNRNNNNGFRLASTARARAAFTIGERLRSGRVPCPSSP